MLDYSNDICFSCIFILYNGLLDGASPGNTNNLKNFGE